MLLIFLTGCSNENTTKNIFLIPNDFQGSIVVFYNVQGEPALNKEGEYSLITVNQDVLEELKGTGMSRYGIYLTSTPDMGYGIVKDRYYYVTENGERKPIDESCTHPMSNGTYTLDNGKEIRYSSLQITKSDCGEPFYLEGSEDYYTQNREVKKHWFEVFKNTIGTLNTDVKQEP